MKKRILAAAVCLFSLSSCDQVASVLNDTGITNDESVKALRTALNYGIDYGTADIAKFSYMKYSTDSSTARGLKDDIKKKVIKILLPTEVTQAINLIETTPGAPALFEGIAGLSASDMGDSLISTMNHAADSAAPKSVNVFKNAITKMNVSDGMKILTMKESGTNTIDSTAATNYLSDSTRTGLTTIYAPMIDTALDKTGANTTYKKFASGYNNAKSTIDLFLRSRGEQRALPVLPEDLGEYATGKALDGLFTVVGYEEIKIRRDPLKYASDVVQKVFSSLK